MASPSRRDRKAERPHFFKIVVQDIISEAKLVIPRKFVRKYGKELSSPVILRVPTGAEWRVELVECDGKVLLQNGWKEFAEFYRISYGSLLVFEYEGSSLFHVILFDMTATEIEYPSSIDNNDEANLNEGYTEPKVDEHEDDVSVEILADFSPCSEAKGKPMSSSSRLSLSVPLSTDNDDEANLNEEYPGTKADEYEDDASVEILNGFSPYPEARGKSSSSLKLNSSVAARGTRSRAGKAKLENNKSQFEAKSGSTCFSSHEDRIYMGIQSLKSAEKRKALQGARTLFESDNPCIMVVMQPSFINPATKMNIPISAARKCFKKQLGKAIVSSLDGRTWSLMYCESNSRGKSYAVFNQGWRKFVQDNGLEVGDVCIFELLKGKAVSFKVVIFRGGENLHSGSNCLKRKRMLPIDIESDSASDEDDSYGFKEQGLKIEESEDDVSDGSRQSTAVKHTRGQFIQSAKSSGALGASRAASKFTSMHPFFEVIIQPSNLKDSYLLRVPRDFHREHLKETVEEVMLRAEERCWVVKFLSRPNGERLLSGGWRAFAIENALQEGNICVFELTSKSDPPVLFKVSIFRHSAKLYLRCSWD